MISSLIYLLYWFCFINTQYKTRSMLSHINIVLSQCSLFPID